MDDALTGTAPDEVQAPPETPQAPPDPGEVRLDETMEAFDDADPLKLAASTLTGDLRDFVLNLLDVHRSAQPMKRRPEAEQRKIIAEITARCREVVEEACRIISVQGGATLTGTLENVTVKGALKATITMSKSDPSRYALMDAQGGDVLVALVNSGRFHGERAPVQVSPDQSDIESYAEEVNAANDAARGEIHLVPPEDVPGALDGDEGGDPEIAAAVDASRPWGSGGDEAEEAAGEESESLGGAFGSGPAPLPKAAVTGRGRRGGGGGRRARGGAAATH